MKITPDSVIKVAIDKGLSHLFGPRPAATAETMYADAGKLISFARHFYDEGVQDGDTRRQLSTIAHPDYMQLAGDELAAQREEYQSKIAQAREVLEVLARAIPGNLLDPYAEGVDHSMVKLQQAHASALEFLKEL